MTQSCLVRCIIDYLISIPVVLLTIPVGLVALSAVFLSDRYNPMYTPRRVGLRGKSFKMLKIRTMVPKADCMNVDSTSVNDPRLTRIGSVIRAIKLDEILQFINVLTGTMSIVGPRPNIDREVALYTQEEQKLLMIRPGITDLSSIVFSDLGEILKNSSDPNLDYNQLVRPWKARLAMVYVDHGSVGMYFKIIWFTAVNIIDRKSALRGVVRILGCVNAEEELISIAARKKPLKPYPPLGSELVVQSRDPV